MKKVLVFYASYGGGHLSAAKSIRGYIESNYPDVEIQMVDCMKYVDKFLEKLTTDAYKEMAKKAPWAWKKVYYNSQKGLLGKISNGTNKMMSRKIFKLFKEFNPDVVISTHPFSSQMTTILKKKGKVDCKLATIITDFTYHEQWLVNHEYVDYFFVASEETKNTIVEKFNIDENKFYVSGIPISERFSQNYDREKILKDFELENNKKTVLFFGGGEYGLGKNKTVAILNTLANTVFDIQVIAIAGKNKKLKEAFEKVVEDNNKQESIKVLPFTDKVPELMSISDLVITKPGGLTVSESLASGLPIIVINPIPGQEEENARFLENAGAAIWIKKDSNPNELINSLLGDDEKLNSMKQVSISLAKKKATANICKVCLDGKENLND